MRLRKTSIVVLTGAVLAVGAPVAAATVSPAQSDYSTPGGVVETEVTNGGPPPNGSENGDPPAAAVESAGTSELPFTGLDVGLVLAAGAMLLAAGFGIRRLSRVPGAA